MKTIFESTVPYQLLTWKPANQQVLSLPTPDSTPAASPIKVRSKNLDLQVLFKTQAGVLYHCKSRGDFISDKTRTATGLNCLKNDLYYKLIDEEIAAVLRKEHTPICLFNCHLENAFS